MVSEGARHILTSAVSLHVLEPEDIKASGKPVSDPTGIVSALEKQRLLSAGLVDTIERLLDTSEMAGRSTGVDVKSKTMEGGTRAGQRPPSLDVESGTLAPESDAPGSIIDRGTIAPDREAATMVDSQHERGTRGGIDLSAGTLEPERDAPVRRAAPRGRADGPQSHAKSHIDLESGTIAPDRDAPQSHAKSHIDLESGTIAPDRDAPKTHARSHVDVESGTIAPDRDAPRSHAKSHIDLESGTLEPERDAPGGAPRSHIDLESGTLEPERDRASVVVDLDSNTVAPDSDRASMAEGEVALDVALIAALERSSPDVRQRIAEAALIRALVKRGLATRDRLNVALDTAYDDEVDFSDVLVDEAICTAQHVAQLQAELATPRQTCGACFTLLSPKHSPGAPCSSCRARAGIATFSNPGATLEAERARKARDKRIDGFPGEGGTFAGYELMSRVAEGGMGVVFKARETSLNRIVALKVMRGGALAAKSRKRRFIREAEAAAALLHPNIVPIHQISEVAGYPFYTMDFVEGLPLDAYVKSKNADPRVVSAVVSTVSDAVHHFHLRGIIHRDLKPDNILVTTDGQPRIIDFGIAKKMTGEEEASWTVEGDVLGTPHYMPPEQAGGRVNEIDARSDIYALGAILYHLITGQPPYHGMPSSKLVVAIQEDDPTPISVKRPDVERDLVAITEKAMAKERERRYQSAVELAQDLQRFMTNQPVLARPATFGYRARKFVRRHRPYVIAGTLLVAGLGAATGMAVQQRRARFLEAERMIAAAAAAPLDERPALLQRVLGMDPDNATAKAQLSEVQAKIELARADERRAEELGRAEERRRADLAQAELAKKADLAQAELAKERAESEARAAAERDLARVAAEEKARREGEERARTLLARATSASTALDRVGLLTDALALVPEGAGELRQTLEGRKVDVAIALSDEALRVNQAGLAEFWLREARKLSAAGGRKADLDRLQAALQQLASGQRLHDEARGLIKEGEWLAAREKLTQARDRGVDAARLAEDIALVNARCAETAQKAIDEGRALLQEGRPALGLARAREALRFASDGTEKESAAALLDACADRTARSALAEAFTAFQRPETRRQALVTLDEAVRVVSGTPAAAMLAAERRHRAFLLESQAEEAMVYVPAVPELNVSACYMQQHEVTNAEFAEFVAAGGYRDLELFDPEARALVPTFRDGTPGADKQPGPRSWQGGSYGDPANGARPVRGISWYEARAFARWRSKKTGLAWRLPTVAEWEVAAAWDPLERKLQVYPWGDQDPEKTLTLRVALPSPVGVNTGDVSRLGLRDMGGNVSEWVEQTVAGKVGPALKGASFGVDVPTARHVARVRSTGTPAANPPVELIITTGFRLVREIGESK